jgi:CubicO group peptidase (beta-lactamase class C family)
MPGTGNIKQRKGLRRRPERRRDRWRAFDEFLRGAAGAAIVPGAVAVAGRASGPIHRIAVGFRALLPRRERTTLDTIYDLASLTKPMATAPLAAEAAARGEIALDDPVARWIEEAKGTRVGRIPIRLLLTHAAGFVPDNPMAEYRGGKRALLAAIARGPLAARPGTKFIYTDVGYVLLQGVLERRFGRRLDRLAEERILRPLGMRDTRFGTRPRDRSRVAPTERVAGRWLRGRVHDPRARSRALGGVAGHAGLFGTAGDVARFAEMILGRGMRRGVRVLSEEAVRHMTTDRAPRGLGVRRGFGFDIASPYDAPRGALFSRRSFGHSGWTGVSIWIDPACDGYLVLLANAVHPNGHRDMKAFRAEAATLAARALGAR